MEKWRTDQKGIGGILIIGAVVFVIIAIVVMAYFLLNGDKDAETGTTGSGDDQLDSETIITDDQVPLRICETGDPEQCHDPVSNAEVDAIVVDDLP